METAPHPVPVEIPVPYDGYDYSNLGPKNISSADPDFDYGEVPPQLQALNKLTQTLEDNPDTHTDGGYMRARGSAAVHAAIRLAIDAQETDGPTDEIVAIESAMRATKQAWNAMSLTVMQARKEGDLTRAAMWAERLNESIAEVYVLPEHDAAAQMISLELQNNENVKAVYVKYLDMSKLTVAESNPEASLPIEERYKEAFAQKRAIILERYGETLDLIPEGDRMYSAEEAADAIEAVLEHLQLNDKTVAWDKVKTYRDVDENVFSTDSSLKGVTINVPMAAEPISANRLRGMVAHELLKHAASGANGAATGDEMQARGMPGYLGFEEGDAISSELAVSGVADEIFADRFTDTAIAAGVIDGERRSRPEMIKMVYEREAARQNTTVEKLSEGRKRELNTHVGRIYEGGPGDEHVETAVIFAKDAQYWAGVLKHLTWWEAGIKAGRTPQELYDEGRRGKNDLTQPEHVAYQAQFAAAS